MSSKKTRDKNKAKRRKIPTQTLAEAAAAGLIPPYFHLIDPFDRYLETEERKGRDDQIGENDNKRQIDR